MPPLQCFNAHLYASLFQCDLIPNQCIAPTAKRTRCSWDIKEDDQRRANEFRHQVGRLPKGQERDDAVAEFVLLHCCERHHRHKLEADRTGCLDELSAMYGALMPALPRPTTVAQEEHWTIMSATSVQNQGSLANEDSGMTLRSAKIVPQLGTQPPRLRRSVEYFVRYKSDPSDTIQGNLRADIPSKYAIKGQVYSFSWPEYPKYIKIGYTARPAHARVIDWQTCNPGSVLQHSVSVFFPERIERLIHLEMSYARYRIGICRQCGKSHEEWFDVSATQANQIISDWAEVATRAPLYNEAGALTKEWRQRLARHDGDITAKALLDILAAEELSLEEVLSAPAKIPVPLVHEEFSKSISAQQPVEEEKIDLEPLPEDLVLVFFREFMGLLMEMNAATTLPSVPEIAIPIAMSSAPVASAA